MAGKPSYAELENRVRELEDRCSLLSATRDSFFVESSVGLALFDRECRYVRINETLAEVSGYSVADHLGRHPRELLPAPAAAEIEEGLKRVLTTGEAACNREISIELPVGEGGMRHWLHSQFPVNDCQGVIIGAGVIVTEITEVKRLLAEVSQKELFLRLLFKNLPQKIFVKNAELRYLYCNEKFSQDLGITPDEIVGKKDEDFFPVEIVEKFLADDQRVMASGKTEDTEEVHALEGLDWGVRTVKAPVVSEEGKPVGLIGIFHDITARKQAEAALAQYQNGLERLIADRTAELQSANTLLLKEIARGQDLQEKLSRSERKYREVIEGTEDLITQVDSQGRLLFVNHAAQKIFGLEPEECLGLSAFDFVHPQDRSETEQAFQDWMRERRKVVVWGNHQLGRNGERHFLHWTCNLHYAADGMLLYANGIARDMTELQKVQEALRQACAGQEKKIAEQTWELEKKVAELVNIVEKQRQTEVDLRESEERFRQIAENINSVFWIRDLSAQQILYISPAYERVWGRSCESLQQKPDSWLDAVHPEDRDLVLARHFPRNGREQGLEYRIIRTDHNIRWIRAKTFIVCDQSGSKYREVGVAEDITTYMNILDRLRESESRYRTFFETSSDGISVYALPDAGERKKFIDGNASYQRLAGRGKEELQKIADIRTLKNFINKKSGDNSICPSLDIIREEGHCAGMYSWMRPDGRDNFIECRGNRLTINGLGLMHCVHRDMTQVKLAEEKIRHLSRRIIESTEEEQKRIARDLHDEFGQRLLAMRHKVDTLQKKLVSAGKSDLPEFAEIDGLIDTIGAVVRGVTNRLRPDLLDTLGFLTTLQWGMRDFAERNPLIKTSMEIVGAEKKIRPEFEIALYRVFQEGLTNIAKHAGAKTVTARLIFSYPCLILTLADDGLGFDQDPGSGFPLKNNGGLGLRSMQERMLAIGGTFVIRSRRGEGMVLRAEVCQPIPQSDPQSLFMLSGLIRS
ncbi:MAG: PAS domain S-box protein [Desulfurivibrionaceae bacterium]